MATQEYSATTPAKQAGIMNITTAHTQLIKALLQAPFESHDLHGIHEQKLLSPAQLAVACHDLAAQGVLLINQASPDDAALVSLTTVGRKWVVENRRQLFLKASRREWSTPLHASEVVLEPFQPYMPRLSKVQHAHFFKK